MTLSLRARAHHLLEVSADSDTSARLVDVFLVAVILINVVATTLETVAELEAAYEPLFHAIELGAGLIYTIEYALRLWSAPENPDYAKARLPRLRFARTPLAVIDLASVAIFWVWIVTPGMEAFLRLFRLIRVLKLTRYSPALETLWSVIVMESRSLVAALVLVFILVVLASGLVYAAEHLAQPDRFASIPATMWWTLATLTTIGYGDMVPITVPGKLIGGVVMLMGVVVIALPIGIIATGFASEIRKRDFAVNARLVASVPLFAGLDLVRLSEITGKLRPLAVPPRNTIVRRSEPADAMYFILEGEVEIDLAPHPVRLGRGAFFGESALLARSPRTATVISTAETQLLVLSATDFHDLIARDPRLKEDVARTAAARHRQTEMASAAAQFPEAWQGTSEPPTA